MLDGRGHAIFLGQGLDEFGDSVVGTTTSLGEHVLRNVVDGLAGTSLFGALEISLLSTQTGIASDAIVSDVLAQTSVEVIPASLTWALGRILQYSFESEETNDPWTVNTSTSEIGVGLDNDHSGAGWAMEGYRSGLVGGGLLCSKYINTEPELWIRFYIWCNVTDSDTKDIFSYNYINDGALTITQVGATVTMRGESVYTVTSTSNWHLVEVNISNESAQADFYWDGNWVGHTYLYTTQKAYLLQLCEVQFGGANGTFHIDAVAIDTVRVGPVTTIGPQTDAVIQDNNVIIDGVPYQLVNNTYIEKPLSAFNPRLGVGAPKYSDMTSYQHHVLESFHHGLGQTEFLDEYAYMDGTIDTTSKGIARLPNSLIHTHCIPSADPSIRMPGGAINLCQHGGSIMVGGIALGSPGSIPLTTLYSYNGSSVTAYNFNAPYGVQDVYSNGDYLFVTLGGTASQMQVGSLSSGTFSFANCGKTANPPLDMSVICPYNGFVWVAERLKPVIHRFAEIDGSDMEGNEDNDIYSQRVGANGARITAMQQFNGALYIGREDGLYALTMDDDNVYVKCVETVTPNTYNYRGMCTYNGYLVFATNGKVYQYNGNTGLQDISPGAISDNYPYTVYQQYASFWPHGSQLYVVASKDPPETAKPVWDILVFSNSGWSRLYRISDANENAMPDIMVAKNVAGYLRVWSLISTGTTPALYNASANTGTFTDPQVGGYELSGYLTTSYMDFGLPLIERALSRVRLDCEVEDGVTWVEVDYQVDGDTTWHNLGIIAGSHCDYLNFPNESWGKKLRLRLTLKTNNAAKTPVLKKTVIRYMDRPVTVWGYEFILDLTESARGVSGEAAQYTVRELMRRLRECRESMFPVDFIDLAGNECSLYVTDVSFSRPTGDDGNYLYIAQCVGIVTARYTINLVSPVQ